ncbi:MAG: septal ring lytic transglycosylase RlpA family protein [Acidobacteria bacterium]|nr:septal ring lytic transglycosylase RlpA family protein [Acidobacteriota bacterium]
MIAFALWSGCARKKKPRAPVPARIGHAETGVASWYGYPYHGRQAANGEIYDMERMTAAHRTLPFHTWVRVENLANGKFVAVRITDRGPFVRGRIIDLSRAAARAIGMLGPGTARVRVVVTAPPKDLPLVELFAVQVGSFRDRSRAEELRARLESRFGASRLVRREGAPPMWRVLVGREPGVEQAEALAERLRTETGAAFVVRLDQVEP